ncbi:MAG: hypothetical protein ACI9UV_001479 [Algoriphagus sp.]|jgi:hypothetical protein
MKKYLILLLIWCSSCQEENFEIISSPSFTVPEIIELNENGAKFKSSILLAGNDPIIEYGFAYDLSKKPTIESSRFISMKGQAPAEFTLEAVKGMSKGQTYFVATFIKTASSTFYSESVSFISEGSKNFIFEKINSKPAVYFGDTIEILGANLEEVTELLLKVKFEDEEVPFFDYSLKGFKIQIPREFRYEYRVFEQNDIRITVQVGDQILNIPNTLKFEKPQFDAKRNIDYSAAWELKGKYLFTTPTAVSYESAGKTVFFPVDYNDDETIRFTPSIFFTEPNPVFKVIIRTQEYATDQLKINESDVLRGQIFDVKSFNVPLEVQAKNINALSMEGNLIINPNPSAVVNATPTSYESFTFSFGLAGPVSSRLFEFNVNNFGEPSTNYFTINYLNPVIPVLLIPTTITFDDRLRATSLDNKSYLVGGGKILSVDMNTKEVKFLRSYPEVPNTLLGFVSSYKDKIYFTHFSEFINGNLDNFYEFDPKNNSLKQLAKFPGGGQLIGKFVVEDELFVDIQNFNDGGAQYSRYSYDFAKNSWNEVGVGAFFVNRYADFEYAGKLYVLGIGLDGSAALQFGLFSWNTSKQQFELENAYSNEDNPQKEFSIAVKGGFAYYHMDGQTIQFDLSTRKVSKRSTLYPLEPTSLSVSNGELVIVGKINKQLVYRIDPEYFD